MRVSVDMTKTEHRRLKIASTMMGVSMRELVLDCVREGLQTRLKESVPNAETRAVFRDTDRGRNLKHYASIEDVFDDLGI